MLEARPCGDAAVVVTALDDSLEDRWLRVHALVYRLDRVDLPGIGSAIATYDSLLVEFDPARMETGQVAALVRALDEPELATAEGRTWTIPVVYGGEFGPDLEDVAEAQGMTCPAAVARQEGVIVTMRCFAAGAAAMLDGPGFAVPVARLPSPRTQVLPGQLAVAGSQAILFASAVPSGWRIIGRTPLALIAADKGNVTAYRPGDRFRFQAIPQAAWSALEGRSLWHVA